MTKYDIQLIIGLILTIVYYCLFSEKLLNHEQVYTRVWIILILFASISLGRYLRNKLDP